MAKKDTTVTSTPADRSHLQRFTPTPRKGGVVVEQAPEVTETKTQTETETETEGK